MGITCCIDSSCSVYLSDGATSTRTTTAAQTVAPTILKTTATQLPATTTALVGTGVTYYSTTIYWSVFFFFERLICKKYLPVTNVCARTYYYYYYTLLSEFSTTTTTRVRTTVASTTILMCTATNTYAAQAIFLSLSSNLPTPTEALVTPPVTPTAGAPIRGSCSPIGTRSVCETLIAGAFSSATVSGDGPRSVGPFSSSVSALACVIAMFCAILVLFL
jgi:hypothetical protein